MKGNRLIMNLRTLVSVGSAVALLGGFTAGQAHAQFADFSGGSFTVAAGDVAATATPVSFEFDSGPFTGQMVAATLTLVATKSGAALQSGPLISESLASFTETITADALFHGSTNLLTVSETGPSADLALTAIDASPLSFVTLAGSLGTATSGFFTFTGPISFTTAFTTTATPTVTGGNLNSFSSVAASGSGGFTASSAVPEPGTLSMLVGIAVTGTGFGLRRMRRRAS
jgi:hypothetical protein